MPPSTSPLRIATISDGFDSGGMVTCPDSRVYAHRLAAVGSETLDGITTLDPEEDDVMEVRFFLSRCSTRGQADF
ncbi:hypothetical protein GUJ93_ZPchr0004g38283 [Zizania palustris]|uniref:Uncharacterized protein n=1 Tax=Zizania palustris TaxID=103762 RepID=A0A8J5V8T1_ZIZPA|nr:hypothetical protein GUJ93_ZPchr0004g38283 [Zizania palustris]